MVLLKSCHLIEKLFEPFQSTFHYGSIKILNYYHLILHLLLSTFHYGSIKIYEVKIFDVKDFHLHSTMVLLKLSIERNIIKLFQNLHSTMVLLKFCLEFISCSVILYLHSTMVLLKFGYNNNRRRGLNIYIPLWFY